MKKIKTVLTFAILPFMLVSCDKDVSSLWNEIGFTPLELSVSELTTDINDSKIRNIIVMIGDGMGYNHVEAGSIFKGSPLCFADETDPLWTYHALVCTDSLTSEGFTLDTTKSLLDPELNDSLYDDNPSPYGDQTSSSITCYTDSAAAGTALATGKKTTNSRIGMGILGENYDNLVEVAHDLGKKTCVISSDELVGATPSAYLSHVSERNQRDQLIRAHATSKADLIITKKPSEWKDSAATTYENLYKTNGFDVCYDLKGLSITSDKQLCLPSNISATKDRGNVTLKESTMFALDYLDDEDEGFFMMVEGACIDKRAHSKLADEEMIELMAFEETVYETYLWAQGRDDTLIIVTADHETGAMYFDKSTATKENILKKMTYLSYNHSRARVRMDVFGDISSFINKYDSYFDTLQGYPYWDNTYIFNLCAAYL